MDYLIAKTSDKREPYYMVLSNERVFDEDYDLSDFRLYDDTYKLQGNEWFGVENFSTMEYCLEFLRNEFVPTSYSFMDRRLYGKIAYIVSVQQDGNYYIFQKVTPSYLYVRYRAISWLNVLSPSEQAHLINNENVLVIKEIPDCIYIKREDRLYFKKLNSITSIFEGINILYREATDSEVENFLSFDMINLVGNFSTEYVHTANRRRIKEAMDRYVNFTDEQKTQMVHYVNDYCPLLLDSGNNKFNISNEKELTELLNAINQRYYTTEIEGERRLANSVTKIIR